MAQRQLVSHRIEGTLVEIFEARLLDRTTNPTVPVEAAATFLGSALMGLLTWWLSEGASMEAIAIDAAFRARADRGTEVALGVAL